MNLHHNAGTAPHARVSALTTYGFRKGHVFAVNDGEGREVLYEHVCHDDHVIQARPVASPALTRMFTQEEFRDLVVAGKVSPRVLENQAPRQRIRALNPDIASARDLDEDEQAETHFYWKLCRRLWEMYEDRETSLTDRDLARAIKRVMGELAFGVEAGSGDVLPQRRGRGRPRRKEDVAEEPRRIRARKPIGLRDLPAPSTVRRWMRNLRSNDWNLLALRDHRRGRSGWSVPKVTDPVAVEVMDAWVRAYLDRSPPSKALLYDLMVGSDRLARENARWTASR
jgi:putative transposase